MRKVYEVNFQNWYSPRTYRMMMMHLVERGVDDNGRRGSGTIREQLKVNSLTTSPTSILRDRCFYVPICCS